MRVVLAALYLRGAPRGAPTPAHRWPAVARLLRSLPESGSASEALAHAGLWPESVVLSTPGLLEWAQARVVGGEALTAACSEYPLAWMRALGASAPPALWREGPLPAGPFVGIVGGRDPSSDDRAWARAVAGEALALGYGIVSGGARGVDSAAASASQGCLVEVLPCGFRCRARLHGGCRLSLSPPDASFSAGQAHERNALVYALGDATVVVRARYREGGTWAGAVDALRRRVGRVLIRRDDGDRAHRALVALGAKPLVDAAELRALLAAPCSPAAGSLGLRIA